MYHWLGESNTQKYVLSFGELLLRISPDADGRWLQENTLPFYIGGAELNVAAALSLWGLPSAYLTALPHNQLSSQIIKYLDEQCIDVSRIYHHGTRMGLYFLTKEKDLKSDALIYDRAHSSFAELKPGMIDWDKVFENVSWFHFSAICPAISQQIAEVCEEALKVASEKNITISIDLNYRSKLWQYGKRPGQIIPNLISNCDIIMGNIWASEIMMNMPIPIALNDKSTKQEFLSASLKVSKLIANTYPKCKVMANTFRFSIDNSVNYYTTMYTNGDFYTSAEHSGREILNQIGSGDCFMAGLIYGFYNRHDPHHTLEFATAAAFGKLYVSTDATNMKIDEIRSMVRT